MTSTLVHSSGSSGYLANPFAVFSTSELAALPSGGYFQSSSAFGPTNTLNALQGYVWFSNTSTAGTQQLAGANFAGWFLHADTLGAFENFSTVVGVGRPPDFIIPLKSTSTTMDTSGNTLAAGVVPLPWGYFKVGFQNNAGVTLASTCGQVWIGPTADDSV
jgi:hypothetical protein